MNKARNLFLACVSAGLILLMLPAEARADDNFIEKFFSCFDLEEPSVDLKCLKKLILPALNIPSQEKGGHMQRETSTSEIPDTP